jgi:cytidyltransferase-like protein
LSILTFDQLAQYRGLVSMVDGSFDPIHSGHLAYFRAARSLGAPLLCNLCPDSETAQKHPILLPAAERAEILNHLDILTYVHVSDRPTAEILRQLQPRAYVKGGDWVNKLPKAIGEVCAEIGTRIVYTARPEQSSSAILKALQPDVDAFAAFVLAQSRADALWQPTKAVPYDFESRKAVEGKHPELIKAVFAPERVLDAGCGPDAHLVEMLKWLGVNVRGCDTQINRRTPHRWTFHADIADPDIFDGEYGDFSGESYDLVICREVFEHMTVREISFAVANLCRASSKYVYGTTRFHPSPKHLLEFTTEFDVDPTHISCGTHDFLKMLFALNGFKWRGDLATAMDWKGYGRTFAFERTA